MVTKKTEQQEQQAPQPASRDMGTLSTQPVTKREPVTTELPDGTKRTDY